MVASVKGQAVLVDPRPHSPAAKNTEPTANLWEKFHKLHQVLVLAGEINRSGQAIKVLQPGDSCYGYRVRPGQTEERESGGHRIG